MFNKILQNIKDKTIIPKIPVQNNSEDNLKIIEAHLKKIGEDRAILTVQELEEIKILEDKISKVQKVKNTYSITQNKIDIVKILQSIKSYFSKPKVNTSQLTQIEKFKTSVTAIKLDFFNLKPVTLEEKTMQVKYAPSSLDIIKQMSVLEKFATCINAAPDMPLPTMIALVFGGLGAGVVAGVIFKIGWPVCQIIK